MSELKMEILKQALERYQTIYPCAARETLMDCFTIEGNRLYFWFNTEDNTTHLISSEM